MKRKVLIVTLNDYVIYQPTILNLYDQLTTDFDVKIISFHPEYVTKIRDTERNVVYLEPSRLNSFLLRNMDFIFSKFQRLIRVFGLRYTYSYKYYNHYLPAILKRWLLKNEQKPDIVIAVDLPALKIAQDVYGSVHFLSLEIENRENHNYSGLKPDQVRSVLIQSKVRLDYIFPTNPPPYFIVQNAPNYKPVSLYAGEKSDFVFAGTARAVFGIFECIEFIKAFPPYRLVQKGGGEKKVIAQIEIKYADLIESGHLELDNSYLPAEEFLKYLSRFRYGFCFYSWDWINSYFNYRTAPSGKLFMYMAAGIPVIACDIPGFSIIKDYNAGILIRDYRPETIRNAVLEMDRNYHSYAANCLKMATDLSFDRNILPYIEMLKEKG